MLTSYYPEMGEKEPGNTEIQARLGHYGRHWFLRTKLALKGRGVVFLKTETAETLVPGSRYVGWHQYKVTEKAFESICREHNVTSESLL
jgi:hypothetical protein